MTSVLKRIRNYFWPPLETAPLRVVVEAGPIRSDHAVVRVYGLESDIKQVQGAACHAHGCSGIREVTAESAEGETPTHVFHVYLYVADCACESVIRCVHSAHRRVWDALSVRLPHAVMEFDIGNIKQSESSA